MGFHGLVREYATFRHIRFAFTRVFQCLQQSPLEQNGIRECEKDVRGLGYALGIDDQD